MYIPPMLLRTLASKGNQPKYQKHIKFFNTHQTLAKKILLHIQKSPYPKNFKNNVFQWFYQLNMVDRIKVCSSNAFWLIEVLHQMLMSNKFRDISIKINEYAELNHYINDALISQLSDRELNDTDTPHYTDYFTIENTGFMISRKNLSNREKLEHSFMKEIKYLTLPIKKGKEAQNSSTVIPFNNVITLSYAFLSDFNLFKKTFHDLSDGECFKAFPSLIQSIMESTTKTLYNFTLPQWLIHKQSFSLCELLVAYFEINIMLNYYFSITYRTLCDFDYYEIIDELYTGNKELIKFLEDAENKNEIYDSINFQAIADYIRRDDDVREAMMKKSNDDKWVYMQTFERRRDEKKKTINEQVNEASIELNKIFKSSIPLFVENLCFVTDDKAFTVRDFVCKKIYEQLLEIREKKVVHELIISLDEKKKKKRKHTKKKKEKKDDEEDAKENIKENDSNNDEEKAKSVEEENITFTDKGSSGSQKEEETIQIEVSQTEPSTTTEKKETNTITSSKSKKKKNKGFFLYNTVNPKKEDKKESSKAPPKQKSKPNQTNPSQKINSITVANTGTFQFIIQQPQIQITSMLSAFQMNLISFSNEIDKFIFEIETNKTLLFVQKKSILHQIENIIKTSLESTKYYNAYSIGYYGSYMTGLDIENSDIDLMVKAKPKVLNTIINIVIDKFWKSKQLFTKITPILTASVPIIKIECDIESSINPEMKTMMLSKSDADIFKAKFDISFMRSNDKNEYLPSQIIIDYIKEKLFLFPSIKPLIFVLKKFLYHTKLNSSYHGGLSSYSVFLMIYAYLKSMPSVNIGADVYRIFSFYANFDFSMFAIDVNSTNPFVIRRDANEKIKPNTMIYDPLTGLNVAKSSFRINDVKYAFAKAANYLDNALYSVEKSSMLSGMFNVNKYYSYSP